MAGRGWGWGALPRTHLLWRASRYPPPPTPPRHSLREWGEGSAPPEVLELCNAFAVGAPAITVLSVRAQLLVNFDQNPTASASHPSALVPVPGPKP